MVTLTISKADADKIRITVIPSPKEGEPSALHQPLSIVTDVPSSDNGVAALVQEYSRVVTATGTNLEQIREAAAKVIEEAKDKAKDSVTKASIPAPAKKTAAKKSEATPKSSTPPDAFAALLDQDVAKAVTAINSASETLLRHALGWEREHGKRPVIVTAIESRINVLNQSKGKVKVQETPLAAFTAMSISDQVVKIVNSTDTGWLTDLYESGQLKPAVEKAAKVRLEQLGVSVEDEADQFDLDLDDL